MIDISMRKLINFLILFAGIVISSQASAQSVHCSYGYQDSSCGPTMTGTAQTPPQCSTAAGWTTSVPAVWQGSHFSSPQCNYQAPPSCPTGWITTASPGWTGSSWTGPFCQIPNPPDPKACQYGFSSGPTWTGSEWTYNCNAPPPPTPTVTCASQAAAQGYTLTNGFGRSGPFTGYYTKFDGSYGHGTYYSDEYGATGGTWSDTCGNSGNTYILYCTVSPTDGSVMGPLTGGPNAPGSASCGGPN
ncbi:hypothetical protein OKW49_006345 [Paraburkholderia youngii]